MSEHVKSLPQLIGKGYKQFWQFKGRYRAVKGGRGSKKSTTASFWFPYEMMRFWHEHQLKPCVLVIRRFQNTHKDSTFAQIRWAINRLGVDHLWKATVSPLELTYKPSGQKIMFRGLDDPQSITSITVADGELCWTWWEEAYQCGNEDDFNKVDLSIRGEMAKPLFKQHTFTFNPWSENVWLKSRFFDKVASNGESPDGSILAITKNYDCNEFLGDDDIAIFDKMQEESPHRYRIEGLGEWGIAEGLIFTKWIELDFDYISLLRQTDMRGRPVYKQMYGLDFGYTNHPTAFVALLANEKRKEIYIFDEVYGYGLKNSEIAERITYKNFKDVQICADSEDPKSIDDLRDLGLSGIFKAKKGPGSVKAGIQKLQDYTMYVHPKCTNILIELANYVWDTDRHTGKPINKPIGEYDHAMDALRYATEFLSGEQFSF